MTNVTKECNRCKEVKPVSEFYERKGYNSYVSECKGCMKERSKTQERKSKQIPRAETEITAISYLKRNGFPALPGKAVSAADVDVVVWGHVWIEVKYSSVKVDKFGRETFSWSITPRQQDGGFLAHIVLLICGNDGDQTFHWFNADHPVFGRDNLKTAVTYFIGRDTAQTYKDNRVSMTDDMMESARDRFDMIYEVMREISQKVKQSA